MLLIAVNDEIMVDYKFDDDEAIILCNCGLSVDRGFI